MEQLWYTSCRNGLGSGSGNMPRAASRGLKDLRSERYARLSRYLRYNLPAGVNPNTVRPGDAPRNLALLEPGKERILLHQVYVGLDYTGMRYGNHFSHLLVDVPKEVTARDAIDLWRSSLWAESEDRVPPGVYDLPLVERTDLVAGKLTHGLLDTPAMQDRLQYILRAYLSLPEGLRLYIVAPSDTIAMLIWGLTQCLPDQLIAGLTFVTYTDNVNAVEARIIGTGGLGASIVDAVAPPDLPNLMYTEKGRVLNCYTDRRSELSPHPQVDAFAAYAAQRLAVADPDLRSLRDFAEEKPAWRLQEFLQAATLFMAVTSSAGPGLKDLAQLLERPEMAARVLNRPPIQEALLAACADLAGSEPGRWWAERGGLALGKLIQFTERVEGFAAATTALIEPAARACQAALSAGNSAAAEHIYKEALLVLVHSDRRRAVDLLLNHLRPSAVPDLQARCWLLSRAAEVWSISPDEELNTEMQPWLEVSWHELGTVLAVAGLPQSWQEQAVKSILFRCEPAALAEVEIVSRYPEVFRRVLAVLARTPETVGCVERFFAAVVEVGADCKLTLLVELARAVVTQPDGEQRCSALLETAVLTPQETIQLARREPTLMAEPGIAHQLVDRYLQLVTTEEWSAWLPLLENPYFAADLLDSQRVEVRDRLLFGIAGAPDRWMRGGQSQVHRLAEATEPECLRSILAEYAERASPRALIALTNRNLTAADVLFDHLIRPWSLDVVASLRRLIEGVYPCAAEDDSEEGWEQRKWLLRRAYELRQGISVAARERFQQIATPLLSVSHLGLVRLAVFLFDLQGRPVATSNATPLSVVSDSIDIAQQWLSIAEGELSTTQTMPHISELTRMPGSAISEDLPIPRLANLQAQEMQSIRKNIERYIEQFKAVSKGGKLEAAYAYFTIICQADVRQRVPLLAWVEELALPNVSYFADNLLACAGLLVPGDGDVYKPDMMAIEEILAADVGTTIIKSLGARKQSLTIVETYLRSLDVASCATPNARTILERITGHPERSTNTKLTGARTLADFWLAVADVQEGRTSSISSIYLRMTDELLCWLGNNQPVIWRVIDLLVGSAHKPQDLNEVFRHCTKLQLPNIDTGRELGTFEAAYNHFLTSGRRGKPADEAARLLLFGIIALHASGISSLTREDARAAHDHFAVYLKTTDAATVNELERLIKQYADEEKKSDLVQNWRGLYGKLPKELRVGTGVGGLWRSIFPGKSRSDEPNTISPASVRSLVGQQRSYRIGFILYQVSQGGMQVADILGNYQLSRDEVEEIYDLWGRALRSIDVQAEDWVLIRIRHLTFPLNRPPTDDDVHNQLTSALRLTGTWRYLSIPDHAANLPGLIQSRWGLDPGPSYRVIKLAQKIPWQAGDVLFIRGN